MFASLKKWLGLTPDHSMGLVSLTTWERRHVIRSYKCPDCSSGGFSYRVATPSLFTTEVLCNQCGAAFFLCYAPHGALLIASRTKLSNRVPDACIVEEGAEVH